MKSLSALQAQMSTREKNMVYLAVFSIVSCLLYFAVISPFLGSTSKNKRLLAIRTDEYQKMLLIKDEVEKIKEQSAISNINSVGRKKEFTLYTFLEQIAGSTGVKDNITYMKPETSVQKESKVELSLVEMKLTGIDMKHLLAYLFNIETSENMIFVRGISITKTGRENNLLNAVLQLETVKS
jgi:general secretion pathway protein M